MFRIQALFEAQEDLQGEIQRLSKELESFVETSQAPTLASYAHKLTNAKQRIENTNALLSQIQDRIIRLEKTYVKQK